MLRRKRFDDLVRRQLDLFAEDEAELLEESRAAENAWTGAAADEAEEHYGDYQLVVDAIGDRLYELRETYAALLAPALAAEYRARFDRAARRRFGRYAAFLEELE